MQVDLPDISADSQAHESDDAEGVDTSVDWLSESEPDSDDAGKGEESPPPPARQAPPKAPDKPQTPPPADEKPAEEETVQPPEDKTQSPDEGQPPAPAPAAETPEQKAARETQEREAQEKADKEHFEKLKEYYKLPDDLAARLATEPEMVLPEMAAKVHQAVVRGAINAFTQLLPQMVNQALEVRTRNEESKQLFYGRWPELKGHEAQVLQVGRMYRQMNPKATKEQATEKIGQIVMAALGLTEGQQPPAQGQPPARRTAAPARPGFRPAATGGAPGGRAPASDNVFQQLAEEFLQEDDGG